MDATKHVLLALGAGWILWILAALSLVTVVLSVERWWTFRRSTGNLHALADSLDARLRQRDFTGAIEALRASGSVAAAIAAAGLRLADRGSNAAREAMESRAALERSRLSRGLLVIGTIGNNAPFVGLFGTVIGVVHAFDALSVDGANTAASSTVMHAIAEALVATAIGIAVALPAVAAYNYLHRRMTKLLEDTEVLTHLVLAYLDDGATDRERVR